MPTEASTEQQALGGGWTLDGEYEPAGKKRGGAEASRGEERADGEPRCKRRWLGVKGLDAEC